MSQQPESAAANQVLLCLDTSSDAAIALCRTGDTSSVPSPPQVLAQERSGDGRRHAETLVPMIQQVLAAAGLGVDAVDAVAVGTGPAPFTGLRVGLMTARAFARSRGLQAYGVCSLDALALAAADLMDAEDVAPEGTGAREVLAVTDARRREVYYARYRVEGNDLVALTGPSVAAPAQVAEDHADLVSAGAVFGPALSLYGDVLDVGAGAGAMTGTAASTRSAPVDPASFARLVTHRRVHGGDLSLAPRYLRRPDVHMSASRKRAS